MVLPELIKDIKIIEGIEPTINTHEEEILINGKFEKITINLYTYGKNMAGYCPYNKTLYIYVIPERIVCKRWVKR